MRHIKFRAWDKGIGVMLSAKDIKVVAADRPSENDNFVLMQYTGLKDRNGVEVYEGDILKVANGSGNGVIRFETYEIKCFPKGFNLPYFCWKSDGSDDSDWSHYCEVIGNIYEHSHLLDNN